MQLSGNAVLIAGGATSIGFAMGEAFLEADSTGWPPREFRYSASHPTVGALNAATPLVCGIFTSRIYTKQPYLFVPTRNIPQFSR